MPIRYEPIGVDSVTNIYVGLQNRHKTTDEKTGYGLPVVRLADYRLIQAYGKFWIATILSGAF